MHKTKILLLLWMAGAIAIASAQNVQLHYDMGKDRGYFTSTVEKFAPDRWGSTFFFVDFNYSKKGPKEAYWEISRELKMGQGPFSFHVEYNGGLHADSLVSFQINNAYLGGLSYSLNAKDFSRGLTLMALYKYIQGNESPSNFQLTAVWYAHLLKGKITLSGFADFWREKNAFLGTTYVFLSEPQLWYNFSKMFALGGEVELGYNFAGVKDFKVCPTVAVKYTFN